MNTASNANRNVKEVVPFLHVSSMEPSVRLLPRRHRIRDESQMGRRRKASLVLAIRWRCFNDVAGIPQGGTGGRGRFALVHLRRGSDDLWGAQVLQYPGVGALPSGARSVVVPGSM
jgi:hypothetical protein